MNKYVLICGLAVLASWFSGYSYADKVWEKSYAEFKAQAERDYSELLKKKIQSDAENRNRINELESQNFKQLNEQKENYEKIIADMRANFKPSGVSKCPPSGNSVSRPDSNSSELLCYRRDELYGRIEKTMAIGAKCDEIRVKYKNLLRICDTPNG